jgi:hypothetical protein
LSSAWKVVFLMGYYSMCAVHEWGDGSDVLGLSVNFGACPVNGASAVTRGIAPILFNNRWNAFTGSDEYVTWEVAPGRLAGGRVVDLWHFEETLNWEMPQPESGLVQGAWGDLVLGTLSFGGSTGTFPRALLGLHAAGASRARRSGRWRSFPYLASDEPSFATGLWDFLCREWNDDMRHSRGDDKLLRFNFFMLSADILPNLQYGETRKRLIISHECTP